MVYCTCSCAAAPSARFAADSAVFEIYARVRDSFRRFRVRAAIFRREITAARSYAEIRKHVSTPTAIPAVDERVLINNTGDDDGRKTKNALRTRAIIAYRYEHRP